MPQTLDFKAFFGSSSRQQWGCLVFTTFTLDEAVLHALLQQHQVPKDCRIVVFHDILRRRNPGFRALTTGIPQSTRSY